MKSNKHIDSPHRLGPISSDGRLVEFDVWSEIYGITRACGKLEDALSLGAVSCADGSDYVLDDVDRLEISTGRYYNNLDKAIASLSISDDGLTLTLGPVNVPTDSIRMLRELISKSTVPFRWVVGKSCWQFDRDFTSFYDKLMSGNGIPDYRKLHQIFETPPAIGGKMASIINPVEGERCLEPSCGTGSLLSFMPSGSVGVDIFQHNVDVVRANQPWHDIVCGDFLEMDLGKFHCIMANPPFSGGQWVNHLKKMLDCLLPGGRLATILPKVAEGDDRVELMVGGAGYKFYELDGSLFSNQGSNQKGTKVDVTMLVVPNWRYG